MHIAVGPNSWIRNLRQTLGYGGLTVVMAAFWTWMGFYSIFSMHSTEANKIGFAIFAFCFGAVTLLLGFRQLRAGLWIGRDRIVVRGTLKTWVLDPSDVTGFVAGQRLAPCPLLDREHGRQVPVSALSRPGILKSSASRFIKELEPVCDDLNTLLKAIRPGTTPHADAPSAETIATHARENYRRLRTFFVVIAVTFAILCELVVALVPKPTVLVFMTALAVFNAIGTYGVLRLEKKQLDLHHPKLFDSPRAQS